MSSLCLSHQLSESFIRDLLAKSSRDVGRWSSDFHFCSSFPIPVYQTQPQLCTREPAVGLFFHASPNHRNKRILVGTPWFPYSCRLTQPLTSYPISMLKCLSPPNFRKHNWSIRPHGNTWQDPRSFPIQEIHIYHTLLRNRQGNRNRR